MNLWKWLKLPSGETVQVQAHDTWHVRWFSVSRADGNGISFAAKERVEVFHDKDSADALAKSLTEAAQLLADFPNGYGGSWGPRVEKNTYKGLA